MALNAHESTQKSQYFLVTVNGGAAKLESLSLCFAHRQNGCDCARDIVNVNRLAFSRAIAEQGKKRGNARQPLVVRQEAAFTPEGRAGAQDNGFGEKGANRFFPRRLALRIG